MRKIINNSRYRSSTMRDPGGYRGIVRRAEWNPNTHKWVKEKVICIGIHVCRNRDLDTVTYGKAAINEAGLLLTECIKTESNLNITHNFLLNVNEIWTTSENSK